MTAATFQGLAAMDMQLHMLRSIKPRRCDYNEFGQYDPAPVSPGEIERQVAFLIDGNDELWHMWVAESTARTDRKVSTEFDFSGPISDLELVQMLFNSDATPEQCKGAGMELRSRFASHYSGVLEAMAMEARGEQ